MKQNCFLIELVSSLPSLARLGKLHLKKSTIETPCCMLTTKGGSVPHLSREVLEYVLKDKQLSKQLLQISLTNTIHMEQAVNAADQGIASFAGLNEVPVFVTLNDPCELTPSGFHERDIVPLFTRKGKESVTAKSYMQIVAAMQPDMYQLLCDSDTNSESSKKRIQKSIDRSERFVRDCLEIHNISPKLKNTIVLAPIVGGYDKAARTSSIKVANEFASSIGGYVLDGLHNNGASTTSVETETLKDMVTHCIEGISNDKMKMMQGAFDPLATLELINLGIDLFDTSYLYLATQNNIALCFAYDISEKDVAGRLFHLDLSEEQHKDRLVPIDEHCECLSCKKHTRAYVHHLIKTRELLGAILIMIHNLHHYQRFFEAIRKSIRSNNLPNLTDLIRIQMVDVNLKSIIEPTASTDGKVAVKKRTLD